MTGRATNAVVGLIIVAAVGLIVWALVDKTTSDATATRVQMGRDLVTLQRRGCERTTADRVDTARKDAQDALRERALGEMTSGRIADLHMASYLAAIDAARSYLSRAGLGAYVTVESIVGLRPENTKGIRHVFCIEQFPGV